MTLVYAMLAGACFSASFASKDYFHYWLLCSFAAIYLFHK